MCKPACSDFQLTSLLEQLKSAIESVFTGIYMDIKNSVDVHVHY
jgi:hypothetical protein